MLAKIKDLIVFFSDHCEDRDTLNRLKDVLDNRSSWPSARQLFNDIRAKTLKAEKRNDRQAVSQYAFEEVCAKTLYNLTGNPAPYDPETPYWIVPNALALAATLQIDQNEILKRVI